MGAPQSVETPTLSGAVREPATLNPNLQPPFSGLTDILDRLEVASDIRITGNLGEPINPVELCAPLAAGIDGMRERLEQPARQVSLATLNDARSAWRRHKPDLDATGPRHVRVLCMDADTATDPDFVRAIAASGQLPKKRRWLEGMIGAYFHRWRGMPQPVELERLLRDAVHASTTRSKRVALIRKESGPLFSAEAASVLAERAVAAGQPIEYVLTPLAASKTGGLGAATAGAALLTWVRQFLRDAGTCGEHDVLAAYAYGAQHLLPDPNVSRRDLAAAIEQLIIWPRTIQLEAFRQALENSVLGHPRLGDPRLLPNRANWELCPRGRDALIRWLSRRDLAFFFDFVMDQTDDPHGRKEFWLRYIDQVVDSTVALSPFDAHRLRVQVKEKISHAYVTETTNVSAFLMRFAGATELIVAEFSRSGNALYVHDAKKFERRIPLGIRATSFRLREDLKGLSAEDTFVHNPTPDWTYRVADYLRGYGIRPSSASKG